MNIVLAFRKLLRVGAVVTAVASILAAILCTFFGVGNVASVVAVAFWGIGVLAIAVDVSLASKGKEWLRTNSKRKERRGILTFMTLLLFVTASLVVAALRWGLRWEMDDVVQFLLSEQGWREGIVLIFSLVATTWLILRRVVRQRRESRREKVGS